LEVVALNDMNAIDGTALFEVEGVYNPDEHGVMLEVLSRGVLRLGRWSSRSLSRRGHANAPAFTFAVIRVLVAPCLILLFG
jgi:hypothetical protein